MTLKAMAGAATLALFIGGAAYAAESGIMTTVPSNGATVTSYYKQNVYDPNDTKIGEVTDLIVESTGKIDAAMVGVGGFLGMGEKDVAVQFDALKPTTKNNKTYLVLNTTKDALKSAPGFKYDRSAGKWVPENASK